MIDWVSAFLPCTHSPLQSGVVFKLNPDGSVEWSTPCRTEVKGSYDDKITVRSEGADGQGNATHLYFSGNPSKFLQGHNIFGSDDLLLLVEDTYHLVCQVLNLIPSEADKQSIRAGAYRLTRLDINYSFELACRSDVKAWLRAAEFKSKTRHGRPSSKGGSLYWGKNSKRWALKAYSKGEEIVKHRLPDILTNTPLTLWADNKLRIELVLRSKELVELDLETAKKWTSQTVQSTYNHYIKRLDMNEQIALSDKQLTALPQRLRSTYILWRDGHDLRDTLPKTTYYRHRKELLSHGINIDLCEEAVNRSNIVPLVRILEATPADLPGWAFDNGLIHHSAQRYVA